MNGVLVSRSRHTPSLSNGAEVHFEIGEVVSYRLHSGVLVKFTIDSGLMSSAGAPGDGTGYEGIFSDTRQRGFGARSSIIGWEGKP